MCIFTHALKSASRGWLLSVSAVAGVVASSDREVMPRCDLISPPRRLCEEDNHAIIFTRCGGDGDEDGGGRVLFAGIGGFMPLRSRLAARREGFRHGTALKERLHFGGALYMLFPMAALAGEQF